jgi:signal transduction histidine kinase
MQRLPARIPWPLLLVLAALLGTGLLMFAPGVGPAGFPPLVRQSAHAVMLLLIAGCFLGAARREAYERSHQRAFLRIGVGFGVAGVAIASLALTRSQRLPTGLALLNLGAYVIAFWGVLSLPRRGLRRADRWIILTDIVTAVVAMAMLAVVVLREGTPDTVIGPIFTRAVVIQSLSALLVLGAASGLAIRGLPVPDARTVQFAVAALCMLYASLVLSLLYTGRLVVDRRPFDFLYLAFLELQFVAAWAFWQAKTSPSYAPSAPARWLIHVGPMPILALCACALLTVLCVRRGADRAALIAFGGVTICLLPILARLVAVNVRRLDTVDRAIAERDARLAAMTRLAGGFAHELNNALTTILNAAALARTAADEPSRVRDLDEVHRAAHRAASLARQTLVASGRTPVQREAVAVAPLLERVASDLREELGARWPVRHDGTPELPHAATDAEHVAALVRLLARAVRGNLGAGGDIMLAAEPTTLRNRLETTGADMPAGPAIRIVVADQAGLQAGAALPSAAILFERDVTDDPALAFDLTVARGLALALEAGLEIRAARRGGMRAELLLPVSVA